MKLSLSSLWQVAEDTRSHKSLYPVETITLLAIVATLILYHHFALPVRTPWFLYVRKVGSGGLMYAVGLLVTFFLIRLSDIRIAMREKVSKSWQDTTERYKTQYLQVPRLIRDLRLVHAIGVMFVVFINLKNLIPHVNSRVYDTDLALLEQQLFGGKFPAEYLLSYFGTAVAPFMSLGYTAFYPYMAIITVVFILQRNLRLGQHFCFAFAMLWYVGILIEYAFPTWGPCFSFPELFSSLPETEVQYMQKFLWLHKTYLERFPKSEFGLYLISGVPSLHVAVVVQGSIYLHQFRRWLAILSWLFVVKTLITTIYFGWHFVTDDVAAVALVLIANWLARRLVPLDGH